MSIQEEVAKWRQHNFPTATPEHQALIISEESGELSRAVLKRAMGIRGTYEEWTAEARKEAADLVLAVYCFAVKEEFDLDAAVAERWAVIRQRDWVANPVGHGVGGSDE